MREKEIEVNFIFVILLLTQCRLSEGVFNIEAIEPDTHFVETVEGYNASLPCSIRNAPRDSPVLTLWYIGTEETPVYSYDQRSFRSPSSWSDYSVIGSRAKFLPGEHPPVLLLLNVTRSDAKTYRCRVDYSNSNSRVAWVELAVVVPPNSIELETKISPVELGNTKDVVCRVFGGSPLAKVVWKRGEEIVDETYSFELNASVNTLDLPADRGDLKQPLICSGGNNDLTGPLIANYYRNVTCGPTSVKISTKDNSHLVEKKIVSFFCTVLGSNPPAKISWFLENNQIKKNFRSIPWENRTTSRLDLHISKSNHGNQLVCRAENYLLPLATLEDSLILNIAYKPVVSLTLGRTLDPNQLKESSDLFFDCKIDSNPPPYKVEWFHQGKLLSQNVSAGVLVSEKVVALRKVSRSRSGRYQCSASNVEGDTKSNNVSINILFAPRCVVKPSLTGVALGEITNVTCLIEADPQNVSYTWEFNNSARKDTSETVSKRKYTEEGLRSTLSYTPLSERDYGTLFCSAVNSVGAQKDPCSFTVISAGPPEQVTNCSLGEVTSHSAEISCQSGFDGGLPQLFLLKIFEARTGTLVFNKTNSSVTFTGKPLESGTTFHASIVAYNSKGNSLSTNLKFHTHRGAAMHKILPSKSEPSPLVWVASVVFGAILVVTTLFLVVWLIKRRHSLMHRRHHHPPLTTVIVKENNPDLINMESNDERLSENEDNNDDSTEGLVGSIKKIASKRTNNYNDSSTLRQQRQPNMNSYTSPFENDGGAMSPLRYPSVSPDINDKTRLTSPKDPRRNNLHDSSRTTTIVRINRDPLAGPESTF